MDWWWRRAMQWIENHNQTRNPLPSERVLCMVYQEGLSQHQHSRQMWGIYCSRFQSSDSITRSDCVQFLEVTKKHDPDRSLPQHWIYPAAFDHLKSGAEPKATFHLRTEKFEFKSRQTKTRNIRFIDISDNCIEWLKMRGEKCHWPTWTTGGTAWSLKTSPN